MKQEGRILRDNICYDLSTVIGTGLDYRKLVFPNNFKVQKVALYDKSENSNVNTYKIETFETDIFLSQSMKFRVLSNVQNQRGYICSELIESTSSLMLYRVVDQYIHQYNLFNIPYRDIYDIFQPSTVHIPFIDSDFNISYLDILHYTDNDTDTEK